MYYKACTKYFPVLTWYYKACTKYFPVLLGTTKLAQSTSQYYLVLQSLHKVLPSTTWYYKACTKYFPVLLGSTKLAQSTSQYYLVLQSLHKVSPITTSYYKASTKYFPVLLRTTKLAQSTSQYYFAEGSLEVKLPTIWRDGKAEVGRVREEKSRSEKIKEGESQKREDAGARKGRKVAIHFVFPMICSSRGSKSNLAKAAGAEPSGQMRDEKLHAVVARSTFASQKSQKAHGLHFWKLRCLKSARRCGAKHICKSNCTKNAILGAFLEVEMSKKCTPLWREAHFQVKSVKNCRVRTTF